MVSFSPGNVSANQAARRFSKGAALGASITPASRRVSWISSGAAPARAPGSSRPPRLSAAITASSVPLVYDELHRIAEAYLRRELGNRTLQPTALINEAYLRLAHNGCSAYENRAHFFGVAARVMRQILVDHARSRKAGKRGDGLRVPLHPGVDFAPERDRIVIALDDALNLLAVEDEHKAALVEMRFFAGMSASEIAECTNTPVHTVRRELRMAQAWLRREIEA